MPFSSTTRATTTHSGFYAVFVPTFLTLLSVGFFLRIGWIIGAAGLPQTFVMISLAVFLSLITALSISSTVTNLKVDSGSVFFLLSRSFGVEIGSAISLPLFLAQSLSISFYAMGFAEMLHLLIPWVPCQETTLALLLLITLINLISPKLVLKTQLIIFVCICLTFLSFYSGNTSSLSSSIPLPELSTPFWTLFALFFPVVTGIEGGIALIRHLKNPSRSIPIGLIAAILSAFVIYLSTSYILSVYVPKELLASPMVMKDYARVPALVVIGILGSTFSAALSSSLSAAGNIKSFAEDGIIPKVLGHPSITLLLAMMIAFFGVSFKNINGIAPLLSMFFLMSYGTLNAATGIEAMIHNPSWRPTLKTPWVLSLLGAAVCFIVMLLIDPAVSLAATASVALLYILMKKRHLRSSWDDMRYSILLLVSRYAIYTLNKLKPSPKTWRPNLLVFVGDPLLRAHLTELTSSMTHKKGFLIISSILLSPNSSRSNEEEKLSLFLERAHIPALIRTKEAPNLLTGMRSLIDDIGIGPLYPNTVVLGASEKPEKIPLFAHVIRLAYKNKKNLLIIRENGLTGRLHIKDSLNQQKSINVWWGGKSKNNSELMLIMAHMLQTSEHWAGALVTLKTAVSVQEDIPIMQNSLDSFLVASRLALHTDIALHQEGDIFTTTMKIHSRDADLVFLGIRPPEEDESLEDYSRYYAQLLKRTENYPPIAYTLAGESLDFSKILS